jgi:hypothetical protein
MMVALARPPILRLARTRRAWLPIVLWIAFVVFYASVLRVAHVETPTDRILLGVVAPFVLPLLVFAILGGMTGPDGITSYVKRAKLFGASGARAAAAGLAACVIVAALLAMLASVAAVSIGHGPGDPALGKDLFTTIWVSALGGATYAAYFSLGATFGSSGAGRGVFLVANWILADAGTGGAALSPHAHIRSLLGGPHAGALSQRGSSIALLALFLVSVALCVWRCRKRAD